MLSKLIAITFLVAQVGYAQSTFAEIWLKPHGTGAGTPGNFRWYSDYSTYTTWTPIAGGIMINGDLVPTTTNTVSFGTTAKQLANVKTFGLYMYGTGGGGGANGAIYSENMDMYFYPVNGYLGRTTNPFTDTFSNNAAFLELRVANPASSFGTYWKHTLNGASAYRLFSGSGAQLEMQSQVFSSTQTEWTFRGSLFPTSTTGSNGDMGSLTTPWRHGYYTNLDVPNTAIIGTAIFSGGLDISGATFFQSTGAASGKVWTSNSTGFGSWQTAAGGSSAPFIDSTAIIKGSGDATKLLAFEVDGFTTGTTRTLTPQNSSYTIAGINITNNFTSSQTFSANLDFGSPDTYNVGSTSNPANVFTGKVGNFEKLEISLAGTSHGTFWRQDLSSAALYRMSSGSGAQIEVQSNVISTTDTQWGFRGSLYPLSTSGNNGDLGYSGTPWRNLYVSGTASIGGVLTVTGAITATQGIDTGTSSDSSIYIGTTGNFYGRTFSGADASCSGVTNGWIGVRTDTAEIQVCIGGAMKKAVLI